MESEPETPPTSRRFAQINLAQSVIAPIFIGFLIAILMVGDFPVVLIAGAIVSAPFLIGFLASLRWKSQHPGTFLDRLGDVDCRWCDLAWRRNWSLRCHGIRLARNFANRGPWGGCATLGATIERGDYRTGYSGARSSWVGVI